MDLEKLNVRRDEMIRAHQYYTEIVLKLVGALDLVGELIKEAEQDEEKTEEVSDILEGTFGDVITHADDSEG